jgi:hypothetical protein
VLPQASTPRTDDSPERSGHAGSCPPHGTSSGQSPALSGHDRPVLVLGALGVDGLAGLDTLVRSATGLPRMPLKTSRPGRVLHGLLDG